ncbi:MAG: hypothetical protein A2X61_11555 [Ignavibacteria bacterium GWB2_35_12]|nr:MAG: hypothetical protein A2X63_07955 [Ignavibacteria bacterium GWA2_35_8]OGU40230.1 MAG: hypothetical protein A2X61_11555 [Ignavibacteria bacterium GWB2_35_12]OGU92546.1 MAG: hypothetical protein A2220_00590 [Ignavibacteria bacterium RIFOXYA2_FULL_35_10]OGV23048.1 MAG: hypothetical protein A2475_15640 [Ignavibacteria bacterium RIFOXYC2_FULL_35_21]
MNVALCLNNEGNEVSLEKMKVYKLTSSVEEEAELIGIIDESGEEYLYPKANFIMINIPELAESAIN